MVRDILGNLQMIEYLGDLVCRQFLYLLVRVNWTYSLLFPLFAWHILFRSKLPFAKQFKAFCRNQHQDAKGLNAPWLKIAEWFNKNQTIGTVEITIHSCNNIVNNCNVLLSPNTNLLLYTCIYFITGLVLPYQLKTQYLQM